MSAPARGRSALELAAALAAQILMLAAFFWTPLARYADVHYSAADLTQSMSLTRIEPGHAPGNQLQSDAVTQMHPWALYNRAELAAGRFPLWNPLNGAGAPHFANYQSAVLSPFSLPFYLLDFKAALLVSAAAKLLVLGFFTYLFLREIGLAWLAATLGGAAFQFAGHNVLLLYFPHVGALCALPAGLWFAERALRRVEAALARGGSARIAAPLAGFAASLVAGLLGGNPEPFYFACWAILAWVLARLVGMWRAHAARARAAGLAGPAIADASGHAVSAGAVPARVALARAAGKFAFAAAVAAGLGSVQVLPFLEYLQASRVLEERSLRQTPLSLEWWPLLAFPDALGNPSAPYRISDSVPPPNYELVNMSYTGAFVLLLACAAPFFGRRVPGRWFFPVFALVWFVYAHDVLSAYDLFALVPTLDMAPMNRSQGVWNFAIACAAAVALDGLLRRTGRGAWLAAGCWTSATGIALVAAAIGATRVLDRFQHLSSPFEGRFLQFVPAHFGHIALTTLLGAAAVALILVVRVPVARAALGVLAICAAYAQTGWLLRNYNPVSPDEFVYPRTAHVEALAAELRGERVAILGRDGLPPDSNMVYGIAQLSSYDGMWVRGLDRLYRDQFGDGGNWRPILRGSHRALRLFGTRHVLAKWGWNFLDSGLSQHARDPALVPRRAEILPGGGVTQTFRCYNPNLDTIMVVLSMPALSKPCTLRFRLEDVATGAVVARTDIASREIAASVHAHRHVAFPGDLALEVPGRPVVFRFTPVPRSAQRDFRIVLECDDGRPGETVIAWHYPTYVYALGEARQGDRRLAGELVFDWSCGDSLRFETVREIGDYTLFRLRDAVPVHALARGQVVVPDGEAAFELVRSVTFDPRRFAVLDAGDPALVDPVVTDEDAARSRIILQFEDADHCYLLAADGRRLAHIEDEATFLANRFAWSQVRRVPASERRRFEFVPDGDAAAKRDVGLVLISKPEEGDRPPAVLEETPGRVRLHVERAEPGTLVVASAWDPGWKARVGGREVPYLRANFAFGAVEIPAGAWEVELEYAPDSFVLGRWIATASLLAAAGALVAARRAAGRAQAHDRGATAARPPPQEAP